MSKRPRAFYNEYDDHAADWLENLIARGVIAPGVVNRKSIVDLTAADLAGFTQVHLFAGIGVWSYSLRRAGWRDEWPIWTGSCPCPPFSAAGKKKACPNCGGTNPVPHVGRTGVFVCCSCDHEWLADERHLWPEMWRLIRDCQPSVVLGEQVASADGRVWLASVRASFEIMGYAAGGIDTCSASVGAPHIRQRLRFAAHRLADAVSAGRTEGWTLAGDRSASSSSSSSSSSDGIVGHTVGAGLEGHGWHGDHGHQSGRVGTVEGGSVAPPSSLGGMADADGWHESHRDVQRSGQHGQQQANGCASPVPGIGHNQRPGPVNGFWRDADWLYCRDGKWRPVEPGTFPLVDGTSFRVGSGSAFEGKDRAGMLRGYGNAVDAEATTEFCAAVMEYLMSSR